MFARELWGDAARALISRSAGGATPFLFGRCGRDRVRLFPLRHIGCTQLALRDLRNLDSPLRGKLDTDRCVIPAAGATVLQVDESNQPAFPLDKALAPTGPAAMPQWAKTQSPDGPDSAKLRPRNI